MSIPSATTKGPLEGAANVDLTSQRPVRRGRERLIAYAPCALTVLVVVLLLIMVDTPVVAMIRYAAYLLLGVLLPGMLLHRSLRGRSDNIVTDVAMGAVTGVALGIAGLFLCVGLGLGSLLWLVPLATVGTFLAVPRLRRHFRMGHYAEGVGGAGWAIAAALTYFAASLVVLTLRFEPLPPAPNAYYVDVYWHMANAAELLRNFPPEVPSTAGRTLRYHYFVNAHIGVGHSLSGVELPIVFLRLWAIPVAGIILGLMYSLTRKITGRNWAGGVAVLLLVAPTQIVPWSWYRPWSSYSMTAGSPSQVFAVLFLLMAAMVLLPLLRGGPLRAGGWTLFVVAAVCGAGSKPSVLPILLGGLGCALLVQLFARGSTRRILIAMATAIAIFVVTSPLIAQASSGSGFKVFGLLNFVRPWLNYVQARATPGAGPWLMPGLDEPGAVVVGTLLIASVVLQFAFVAAAFPLIRRGGLEPVVAFLAGGWLLAMLATAVIDHPGASEIYFARTGTPLGVVLAVWGLAVAVDAARLKLSRSRLGLVLGASIVVGGVLLWLTVRAGQGPTPPRTRFVAELLQPLATLAIGVLIVMVAFLLVRQFALPWLRGSGAAALCALGLSLLALQGPWSTASTAISAATDPAPRPLPANHVTRAETEAARWMAANVPTEDVAATNVHCQQKKTVERCQARSYWVPALTEHRFLVESWAYTEETLGRIGEVKGSFVTFPFDDPKLLAMNDAAFQNPSEAGLRSLKERYGVRWLFAVSAAGPVSPRLDELAYLRFSNSDVKIYELK